MKKRLKVYLAGAMFGKSDATVFNWRAEAMKRLGDRCVDPSRRDYRKVTDLKVVEIVTGDKDDIRGSDVLLAMCLFPSWGTSMEIFFAKDLGKWVIIIVPKKKKVSPWLIYHSDFIVHSVEDACDLVEFLEV